jgi:hypothetical protein
MKSWQIPISSQSDPAAPAHWFEKVRKNSASTVVLAACDKCVNPHFAKPARAGHPQCAKCVFALKKDVK